MSQQTQKPAYDPSDIEQAKLNTGRLMRAEADVILPLLWEKREASVAKIVFSFRAGDEAKLTALAAELSILEEMRTTISNKIKQAEVIERKVYGQT